MARAATAPWDFEPSGFFVLRTPLLPLEAFVGWADGVPSPSPALDDAALKEALREARRALRERLRSWVDRPEVREALFVASASLSADLPRWQSDPESERGQKVEASLIRYFARMCCRSTPFGLFSGLCLGELGEKSALELAPIGEHRRHAVIGTFYAAAVARELSRELGLELRYQPNPTLYGIGGRLVLQVADLSPERIQHRQHTIESTDYLQATLARAAHGATPGQLADALVKDDPEVSREDALGYVGELIHHQVLVPLARPAVTEPDPVPRLVRELERSPRGAPFAAALTKAQEGFARLSEESLGLSPERFLAAAEPLQALPVKGEVPGCVKVDLAKRAREVSVGPAVISEIARAVRFLAALRPPTGDSGHAAFVEELIARYEGREVPLVEVFDSEAGIEPRDEPLPSVLEGLPFSSPPEPDGGPLSPRLLERWAEALREGREELELSEADLPPGPQRGAPMPDALSAWVTLFARSSAAVDEGRFKLLLRTLGGGSGVDTVGRFASMDEGWQAKVLEHLRREEALRPGVLFAEIVHLPTGKADNIVTRPAVRSHEIPIGSNTSVDDERRIPLTDLLLSVRGGRLVLRSRRLGVEVHPTLTSAHNYIRDPLRIYRFLCALRNQGVGLSNFSWGALSKATFLPRVVFGKVILSLATWNLTVRHLERLSAHKGERRYRELQRLRAELRWPRHVVLVQADRHLSADLDNVLSAESFADSLSREKEATVTEGLLSVADSPVVSPEGHFAHELVIPFLRKAPLRPPTEPEPRAAPPAARRSFPPGSECLYLKLYCGSLTGDRVLKQLSGAIRAVVASGAARRWFFIRYRDPGRHLRLRFFGEPARLEREVLPALRAELASAFGTTGVWRVQLDTYEREVERYGGDLGVELSERLFHADSDAALSLVELLESDELEARWPMALASAGRLLTDLGFDLAAKRELLARMRTSFAEEHGVDKAFEHGLSERYRRLRKAVEAALAPAEDEPVGKILEERSRSLRPLATELAALRDGGRLSCSVESLAWSYLHMTCNRILRSAARAQELVIYDFMHRAYESAIARAGKGAPR